MTAQLRRVAAPVAVAAVALAAAAGVAVRGPHLPGVDCPSRMLTGLDCPGCGASRSVAALLEGDLVRAVDHHVLLPVVAPLLVWAWAAWFATARDGKPRATVLDRPAAAVVTAVVVTAFTVIRNTGWFGDYLASGAA